MNKKWHKRIDLVIVLFFIVAAAVTSLRFQLPGLAVIFVYLVLPAIYLCFREKKNYRKLFVATALFGTAQIIMLDFIEEINHTWTSLPARLVFPQKILGLTPIDYVIFYFVWNFFICVFYEHFLDDEKNTNISRHLAYTAVPFVLASAAVISLYAFAPHLLILRYAYLTMGLVAMAPAITYMCFMKPKLLAKTIKLGVFFFILFLVCELTSLKTNVWSFPGEYIGTITLFGLAFPIEEFIFFVCVGAPAVIAYYEFAIDDGK